LFQELEVELRNQRGDYYLETPWGSILEAKSMESPDSPSRRGKRFSSCGRSCLRPKLEDIWTSDASTYLMDKEGSAVFISHSSLVKMPFIKLHLYGQLGRRQRRRISCHNFQ